MEFYRTKDGLVSKYVHNDGSETTIKHNHSCGRVLNRITGEMEETTIDKNKFSVFVSNSVGCPIGCKFCYLTAKKFPYYPLTQDQIFNNIKEALTHEAQTNPDIRKKYMKLSWMGMGDILLRPTIELVPLTAKILKWALSDYCVGRGLDGVDISTVLPYAPGWPHQIARLNDFLKDKYRLNPNNNSDRSIVRLFYSLYSADNHTRKYLIPTNMDIDTDLEIIGKFNYWYGIDVITHHVLLKDVNDSHSELTKVYNRLNKFLPLSELRFLRYNKCEDSIFEESPKFDDILKMCSSSLYKVKYQISTGSEIKAACGQFSSLDKS
jgi:adenine C2-methylase RlmN of 23S rRNA A2503 and tRNA A37